MPTPPKTSAARDLSKMVEVVYMIPKAMNYPQITQYKELTVKYH